ncbi:MAG: hypothetical protein V4726_10795 [Verrucomicrobiota bacterium]
MNFSDLFTDGDHRFQPGLRRGQPADFFRPSDPALTAERRQWLGSESGRSLYSALLPGGVPLLREFRALAVEWGAIPAETEEPEMETGKPSASPVPGTPPEACARLGEILEPDFLLVRAGGEFPLLGGCVCFPSSWSPAENGGWASPPSTRRCRV